MLKIFIFIVTFLTFTFAQSSFNIITPLPHDRQKAEIGKMIFFDKTLSKEGNISCETCHNLYWQSSGTNKNLTKTDTPTILNSAYNYLFFKDGKVDNIYKQVEISITSPKELNTPKDIFVNKILENQKYNKAFYEIYKQLNYETVIDAIVNYEKSLITPNSKYDNYISGSTEVFTPSEKRGYFIFNSVGCAYCHNGVNLGGNLVVKSSDRFIKVPMLRNLSKTAPYFYDKITSDIKDVLHIKNSDLISSLNDQDIEDLYNFLLTLDGNVEYIKNDYER